MAGSDSKQLLSLIRSYTTEKSEGERRILKQKKRIEELRSELEASNIELEQSKRDKEMIEQELKGYEVELSMNNSSLLATEARIALTNNEIFKLGSILSAVKSEESSLRDGFIEEMLELNAKIRKFQECVVSSFNVDNCTQENLNGGSLTAQNRDADQARLVIEHKLAQITLHTNQEEQQYKAELEIHDQVKKELSDLERQAVLLESVVKENMELQELSRQTTELEEKCTAFGEELQKRFLCPRCNQDNSEGLGEILQG